MKLELAKSGSAALEVVASPDPVWARAQNWPVFYALAFLEVLFCF